MSLPDEELISAFLDDELSPEERVRAEQLLVERADLRRLLDELRGLREGLQALPTYALGDEFGSSVMRRAEREVFRGDNGKPLDSLLAAAPAKPQDLEPPAAEKHAEKHGGENRSVELNRVDWDRADRWRRPAVWALMALAAALVLTFVERNMFAPREGNVALKPAEPAPAAPEKLGEDSGKLGDDREAFSKDGAAGGGGFRAKGDAGALAKTMDAKSEGGGALDAPVTAKKLGDAAAPAKNDVAFGAMRKDGFSVGGGQVLEAEGLRAAARGGAVTQDASGQWVAGQVITGQGNLAYGDLAGIAQSDFNRALTIASQVRAMENETETRGVSAVQLQQRLAQVEEANYRSRQNVAGDALSQSFSNAASPAAEGQAMKAGASRGPAADMPQQAAVPSGAAVPSSGQVAQNEQLQEKQALRLNGGLLDQAAAPSNPSTLGTSLGRNVLVVTVEGTEEAISKVFAPALRREQIADLNNSWQTGDASFAAAESNGAALQSGSLRNAVPDLQVGVSNAVLPQDADMARALARRTADKGAKENVETKVAGEKSATAKSPGSSSSEEYFYVVAPEGSLESALNSLRAEFGCVHNLTVEPGPTTPVDESRWASYNRSGVTTSTSLPKPEPTSAVAVAKPAAVPAPAAPAAAAPAIVAPASIAAMPNDSRSEAAPKSKVAASATPMPATAAAPVAPPTAPAAKGAPSTSSSANTTSGSTPVVGGILSKSGAGTLVLGNTMLGNTVQGSLGDNGFSGQTMISGSPGLNNAQGGVSAAGAVGGRAAENKPQLSFGTGGVVMQQIVPTSPALPAMTQQNLPVQISQQPFAGSQQFLPMSRAQRLTSRQVAVLESAAMTATDSTLNLQGAASQGVAQMRPLVDEPGSPSQRREPALDSLKRETSPSDGSDRTSTKYAGETSSGAGATAGKSGERSALAPSIAAQPPVATSTPAARPGEPMVQQQERAAGQETPTTNQPFVWSFAQSSPPLPADYREAIFVFRVVSPEAAQPVMNDAQTKDAVQPIPPLTK